MMATTIDIPNHGVSFFKKMISKMGWTYSEADAAQSKASPKEQALAKVDRAFGQLQQMKEGKSRVVLQSEIVVTTKLLRANKSFSYAK
jgi:hypothetical protein